MPNVVEFETAESQINETINLFNSGLESFTTDLNKDLLQTKQSLASLNINQQQAELEAQQQNDNLRAAAASKIQELQLGMKNINDIFQNSLKNIEQKQETLDLKQQKALESLGIQKDKFERDLAFQRNQLKERFDFNKDLANLNFENLQNQLNTQLANLDLAGELNEERLKSLNKLSSLLGKQASIQKAIVENQTQFAIKNARIQQLGFEQAISGQKILSRKALANRRAFASQSAGHSAVAQELAVFDLSLRIGEQIAQAVRGATIQKERVLFERRQSALKKAGINVSTSQARERISLQKTSLKSNKMKIGNEIKLIQSRLGSETRKKDLTDAFFEQENLDRIKQLDFKESDFKTAQNFNQKYLEQENILNNAHINLLRNNARLDANIKLRNIHFQTQDSLNKISMSQMHLNQKLSLNNKIYNSKANFLQSRIDNTQQNITKAGALRNAFA